MDNALKKTVLRMFTYGLYAATAKHGSDVSIMTVNWLTQCSFEPPLLVLAVEGGSAALADFAAVVGLDRIGDVCRCPVHAAVESGEQRDRARDSRLAATAPRARRQAASPRSCTTGTARAPAAVRLPRAALMR